MNLRSILLALGCALLSPRAVGFPSAQETAAPSSLKPSFIVVLVDDWALTDLKRSRSDRQRWNDLVCIDGLAARGLAWNNFYSQTLCNPTRATLMLGEYRGAMGGGTCNPPNERTPSADVTIAKILGRAGYTTAAFGKWHIGANPDPDGRWEDVPRAYGFHAWRAWNASNLGGNCGSTDYSNWIRVDDGVVSETKEYHTSAVASAAREWWQETEGPKFAYVSFQAPHGPLHVPPAALMPARSPKLVTRRDKYDAMLVVLDRALGQLLDAVDHSNTYVFVLGDNGTPSDLEQRGRQKSKRSKGTTYENGVNVPLIVTGPGIERGETDALGHVVDLMATLAELGGTNIPSGAPTDSVSLRSVLSNPMSRARDHVICSAIHGSGSEVDSRETAVVFAVPGDADNAETILKGRWVENAITSVHTEEFYDLSADMRERRPIARDESLAERYLEPFAAMDRIYRAYRAR